MSSDKTYLFRCPVCRKIFKADEPGEPCCTGPSEMRDDHELTVMLLVSVTHPDCRYSADIALATAERRAAGPLLLPGRL